MTGHPVCPKNVWNHTNGCDCASQMAVGSQSAAFPGEASPSTDRNMWGTPKADVGDGFCPDCEREEPGHYASCPRRPNNNPAQPPAHTFDEESGRCWECDGHYKHDPTCPTGARASVEKGDRAYWTDPDGDLASRWGTVTSISKGVLDDGIVVLDHDTEVLPEEISRTPDGPAYTPGFSDEDGEHAPQEWGSVDADDRYPRQFVEHVARRDGARLSVTPGDAASFSGPGYSWRAEIGQHFYSGQADTLDQAQRDAVSAADYVTSGRAEADYWDGLGEGGHNEDADAMRRLAD